MLAIRFKFLPFLFFCLLFYSNPTFSQKNNWDISLAMNTGDTIQGNIYYKNKFKAYHSLTVKTKSDNLTHTYLPKEVMSFTIKENEQTLHFKSLIIDADYSPAELSKLSFSPKIELTTDTVFAQLLLHGKISVYFYVDRHTSKNHYIIETANGKATDLISKRYYVGENRSMVGYNREYKKQLLLLLASPSVSAVDINTAKYEKDDILNLVKNYNNKEAPHTSDYEYREEKAEFNLGFIAGSNLTFLKMGGTNTYDMSRLKFYPSWGFNAGVVMNIIVPQTQKRWSFYSELLYSNYTINLKQSHILYQKNNEYKFLTDASVKASYARLFLAVRYQSNKRLAPFIQFGIGNGYAFKYSTFSRFENYFYTITSTESKPFVKFRKFDQSLFLGFGLKYKKIGFELRNEVSNGFSNESTISSTISSTYILVSYTF